MCNSIGDALLAAPEIRPSNMIEQSKQLIRTRIMIMIFLGLLVNKKGLIKTNKTKQKHKIRTKTALMFIYGKACRLKFKKAFVRSIAIITIEPTDKISFLYNCMQTRLRGQFNGK